MIKRCKPYMLTEEDKDALALADWIWNSHYWIESYPGYMDCMYCGKKATSNVSIRSTDDLCPGNPAVSRAAAIIKRTVEDSVAASIKRVMEDALNGIK